MSLVEVLTAVAAHVAYLRASTAIEGDDWVSCAPLVSETDTLIRVVGNTKDGFATDDDAVAASLFTQAYAFRVAGVALAAYALDLPIPVVEPSLTAVRLDRPRPSAVAYLDPQVRSVDADALAAALVERHLLPFVMNVHDAFRVGERLVWGNVAASCAAAFRAVESSGADRALVRDRAGAFMNAARTWFAGLGAFTVVEHAGRDGWYWDRGSCCLWFRTTNGGLCDNCSLIDPAELLDRRIRELAEYAS